MGTVRSDEFVITRGDDVWIWDDGGSKYLDAAAVHVSCNVGHGRTEINDAIADQLAKLSNHTSFGRFAHEPGLRLAERLSALAPFDDARVLLGSGGSDAVDTSAKLARRYWYSLGEPDRVHLISRVGSYHGVHGFGTSISGIPANREGMGPLIPDVSTVEWDSLSDLADTVDRVGPGSVAAVYIEPVMGASGFRSPPEGYFEGVAEICRDSGALLIVDEVLCGFGRLGKWFGHERWPGVNPDLITFAKGVSSGYLPLGGVLVSPRVAEPFWSSQDAPSFNHGMSFGGHATACAAALANIETMEREGLFDHVLTLEGEIPAIFSSVAEHPLVSQIWAGVGFLAGIEIDPRAISECPSVVQEIATAALDQHVMFRPQATFLPVSPPLTATLEHFELAADAALHGLNAVADSHRWDLVAGEAAAGA
jgi:adenosylmethionine-8-amino-7-oxononanoate aminotransferase